MEKAFKAFLLAKGRSFRGSTRLSNWPISASKSRKIIPDRMTPYDLRREVLYPVLDRCGIKRTPRADGFHAFRRAASKYLRKVGGLELAAVQLGHKRMTTTDEHYNDRDMDDLKKAQS